MSGKQSGLGMRFLLGGYDISGDINAIDTIAGGPAGLDVTDITQEAHSRIGGKRDGSLSFTSFFDAANAHPVLSALPRTDVVMAALVGTALGYPAAVLNAKQIDYPPARATDAGLTMKVDGKGNAYGLEWGIQGTPGLRTDTSATDGSSLDHGAATTHGLQAYLQVTAFTGTDVTISVEHSADNSTFTSLIGFTAVTAAPAQERKAVTGSVDEYLRVSTSTTGGFSSVTFSVVACRNLVAVSF
jgi:hypothetical protein